LDGNPDLQAAVAGDGVEILAVALEVGCVDALLTGCWQPFVPDRAPGAAYGGNVTAVSEHGVPLRCDAHPTEFARHAGEVGDFDAGDVVTVACVVAVANHAVGDLADLIGYVAKVRQETLP